LGNSGSVVLSIGAGVVSVGEAVPETMGLELGLRLELGTTLELAMGLELELARELDDAVAEESRLSMTGTRELGTPARVRLPATLDSRLEEDVKSGALVVRGAVKFRNGADEAGLGVLEGPTVPTESTKDEIGVGVGLALLLRGTEDDGISACVASPVSAGSSEVVGLSPTLAVANETSVSVGSASPVGSSDGKAIVDELTASASMGSAIPEGRVAGFPSNGMESES
jgi:hypothetical protein